MKRIISLIMVLLLTSMVAFADTISSILPVSSIWAASSKAYISDSGYNLSKINSGESEILKGSSVEIESYLMDEFYVFSFKRRGYLGLSKIVYVLKDADKYSKDDRLSCKESLINAMKRDYGSPNSESSASAKWEFYGTSVEIGIGKFDNYTGTLDRKVGIIVKGTNVSKSAGQIIDSFNAKVPKDQEKMRKYMFDPYRLDNVDLFISGLSTIDGLTYQTGSKGAEITGLQNLLVECGLLQSGDVDGAYGKKTQSAISSFQSQNGLKSTGIADLKTQFMLVMKNASMTRKESCHIAQSGNYAVVIWPLKAFYIGTVNSKGWFDTGTYYYVNGEYYAGSYKNNLRSGQGTAHFPNGDIYIGQWDKDSMNGKGTYYFGGKNSKTYYEGEMSKNEMTGKGTYWNNGTAITGTFIQNRHVHW